MGAEAKLQEFEIALPEAPIPVGKYLQAVQVGETLHIAGHGPCRAGGHPIIGKIGDELTFEQGVMAARLTALNTLAIVRDQLGSLDRVVKFVMVVGRVHAVPDFERHAEVIDGYTDLMLSIFGNAALCARAAPGMGSAPFRVAIIANAILQIK